MTNDRDKLFALTKYKGGLVVVNATNSRLLITYVGNSIVEAYVDKTRKNETVDLWHSRLGHVNCHKLKVHQLPYEESSFRTKALFELVHSDIFGPVKQPYSLEDKSPSGKSPWKTRVHVTSKEASPSQLEELEEIGEDIAPPQHELRR
ncbi:Retrovirus-related Pol polyprotein from transposon TNT 1-94 [Senna tora]|uniref:Retrovirus-related Pol polyprotein from transposon TNT 1-94 n=1 Tax=Senna tora TaxID=362788 RepID=A0A834T4N7_9FABA|nr:Retrovirus-related Pol polyprotein from transposon TNT 1-94 [Senna tora]